jgi:hypothetical protein
MPKSHTQHRLLLGSELFAVVVVLAIVGLHIYYGFNSYEAKNYSMLLLTTTYAVGRGLRGYTRIQRRGIGGEGGSRGNTPVGTPQVSTGSTDSGSD